MDLSIVPEHKFCVLRGLGQRPNKHETGGLRVNGIRLFSQSGYRFALLASPFSVLQIFLFEHGCGRAYNAVKRRGVHRNVAYLSGDGN